jgi:hypothetical protein
MDEIVTEHDGSILRIQLNRPVKQEPRDLRHQDFAGAIR